jgi:DNA-binding MarR family transcriptional regulator
MSGDSKTGKSFMTHYLESLALVERLHRLLLDVIKDEFERVGVVEINPVQAVLVFNIGDNEVTAGELKSCGYYQGSNVSYNLKKLVGMGYMHHERCRADRRSVRVRLTDKGHHIRGLVNELFEGHAAVLQSDGGFARCWCRGYKCGAAAHGTVLGQADSIYLLIQLAHAQKFQFTQ